MEPKVAAVIKSVYDDDSNDIVTSSKDIPADKPDKIHDKKPENKVYFSVISFNLYYTSLSSFYYLPRDAVILFW